MLMMLWQVRARNQLVEDITDESHINNPVFILARRYISSLNKETVNTTLS